MKATVIGHISSIEAHDLLGARLSPQEAPRGYVMDDTSDEGVSSLDFLATSGMDFKVSNPSQWPPLPIPLHVIVPDIRCVSPSRRVIPHGWRYALPLRDLAALGIAQGQPGRRCYSGGFYACSAEMALLQMASKLSKARLALLIDQVLGSFRIVRPEAAKYYQGLPGVTLEFFPRGATEKDCLSATAYGLRPLTSLERIHRYLDAMPGAWGSSRVCHALPLTCEQLASPLEAQQYILAFASRHNGSLGIRKPQINEPLPLEREARSFIGSRRIIPDFSWPERRIALEVNGLRWHGGQSGIEETSRRSKAYQAMGWQTMTITAGELANRALFESSMRELSHMLGHSLPDETPAFVRQRDRLRRDLFDKHDEARNLPSEEEDGWLEALLSSF